MSLSANPSHRVTACAECDLLLEEVPLAPKCNALCPRCGHVVREGRPDTVMNALVLSVTGLVLFIPAVGLPILSMSVAGLRADASLIHSALALLDAGYWHVSALVLIFAVVMPFLNLWLMLVIGLTIRLRQFMGWLPWLLRMNHHAREWSMTEVFFLGVLVAIVKLKDLAHLLPDAGLFCYLGLMVTCILLNSTTEEHELWQALNDDE